MPSLSSARARYCSRSRGGAHPERFPVMSSYLTARNYAHLTQLPPTEPGVHGCDARSIDQMIGPSAEPHQGPRPRTGDVSSSSEAMGMLQTTSTHTCRTPRTRSARARAAMGKRCSLSHILPMAHARPAPSAAAGRAGGARRAAEKPPRPPRREEAKIENRRGPPPHAAADRPGGRPSHITGGSTSPCPLHL